MKKETNKPEYNTKHGAINGALWANEKEGKNGVFTSYTIQIDKSFTTDDGKTWQKTKNFFAQDMTNLEKVVKEIKEYLDSKEILTETKNIEGGNNEK